MTHIYQVTGMTCNGCKSSIEKTLLSVEGIEDVKVDMEQSEVHLTFSEMVTTEALQYALPKKYKISEKKLENKNMFHSSSVQSEPPKKGTLEQLFPLFLIFGYILIASILLNKDEWSLQAFMLDFMGLFFIVFSFFKLLDFKGFPESFKMYDPLAKAVPAYAWIYPFIEVVLGLMFLMRFEVSVALIATLIILGLTTYGITKVLMDKKSIQCACLGTALKLPMTKATFIENSVMIVMAVIMLLKTYN